MPDGRTPFTTSAAAVAAATLAALGLGVVTAAPASAAPVATDLDAAQARVDRLSAQAAKIERRHDRQEAALKQARTQQRTLAAQAQRQLRAIDLARTELAAEVVDDQDADPSSGAGTAAATPSTELNAQSKLVLANVSLVSEDAGATGDALADAGVELAEVQERQAAVTAQVPVRAKQERALRVQERRIDARVARATATRDALEKKAEAARIAAMGGPAVAFAKSQVGKSYVYGAAGPDAFDCSGLTMTAWQQAGVSLPHNSGAQYAAGDKISREELQPGDLVFYYSPISHVGIYVGDGQVVSALNPGSGVKLHSLDYLPFSGAARVG